MVLNPSINKRPAFIVQPRAGRGADAAVRARGRRLFRCRWEPYESRRTRRGVGWLFVEHTARSATVPAPR